MNCRPQQRATAVLEVLGVYLTGGLVSDQLIRFSGISFKNPLESLSAHITGPELITASGQLFVLLTFQYAGYFLLIIPINWWYRRRGPAAYGVTRRATPGGRCYSPDSELPLYRSGWCSALVW